MEEVVGFNPKQREFFLNAYGHRCAFHWKENGKWVRCKNTRNLQIHHIYPRGWCKLNMRRSFPVNGANQGICLCTSHHWRVHPDMLPASKAYKRGDKLAYESMMETRRKLNSDGIPYWNTTWDLQFLRINKRFVGRYLSKNKYPKNGSRGLNGRK